MEVGGCRGNDNKVEIRRGKGSLKRIVRDTKSNGTLRRRWRSGGRL